MLNYIMLKRLIGVRKLQDFKHPKLLETSKFKLPVDTGIFWPFNQAPTMESPLLANNERPRSYLVSSYIGDTVGRFKRLPMSDTKLIAERKREVPEIEYTRMKSKLSLIPVKRPVICDFSTLYSVYKYQNYAGSDYDKQINTFKSIIRALVEPNLHTERHIFIPIHVPDRLPTIQELMKLLPRDGKKFTSRWDDLSILPILEIFRFLNKDTHTLSTLSEIRNPELANASFLFIHNGKITECNLKAIYALSSYSSYTDKHIPTQKDKKATLYFLKYLLSIILNSPKTEEELEKEGRLSAQFANSVDDDISEDEIVSMLSLLTPEETARVPDTKEEITLTVEEILTSNPDIKTRMETAIHEKVALGMLPDAQADKLLESLKTKEIDPGLFKPVEDPVISPAEIKDRPVILDKSMLQNHTDTYDKKYLKEVFPRHLQKAFHAVSLGGLVIEDHTVVEESDAINDIEIHRLTVRQSTGHTSTVTLRVPKMNENGEIKMNGNIYTLGKQKLDRPIRKINAKEVALTSYYGKLFIRKAVYNNADIGKGILKQLSQNPKITLLVRSEGKVTGVKLPQVYFLLMRYIKGFKYKNILFGFDYHNRAKMLSKGDTLNEVEQFGVLCGISHDKKYYFTVTGDGVLHRIDRYGKKLRNTPIESLMAFLDIDQNTLPVEYAVVRMLGQNVPLALPLIYKYGLKELLAVLKASYRVGKNRRALEVQPHEFVLTFDGEVMALDKNDPMVSLIFGGLVKYNRQLKEIVLDTLNHKNGLSDLMHLMGYPNRFMREFLNQYNLFVDPITAETLAYLKEPTTFEGLLVRSAELLKDDYALDQNDVRGIVIKNQERYAGMVYHILSKAARTYNHKLGNVTAKLTVNPYELYGVLASDATFTLKDDLNPIEELKTRESVTMSGVFGRDKSTITMKDRTFHTTEVGIISEATKDSADVGVTAYLSADPNIDNVYGIPSPIKDDELSPSNVFSPSVLLAPFAVNDDGKRALYISIQNKHVIPVVGQQVTPVLTGYEYILPYRVSDKYCTIAKRKGRVVKVTSKQVVIAYDDTTEKYKLGSWHTKETGGTSYRHVVTTALVEGDTIHDGDVITYDAMFFTPTFYDRKKVVYKAATMAKMIITDADVTHEDSNAISERFAKRLGTHYTTVKSIVIPASVEIETLPTLDAKVDYNTPLLSYIDTGKKEEIDLNLSETSKELLSSLDQNAPKAETVGKITNIEIFYNVEPEEMSDTVKALIQKTDKTVIEKYGHTGRVNNTYSIKGNPLNDGYIEIKFYIEKTIDMTLVDKLIVANQLKATVGKVYPSIVTESGKEVDINFGNKPIEARIVESPDIIGILSTIMMHANKEAVRLWEE